MNTLNNYSGIFLFDKPYGWTSFNLVKKVRTILKKYTNKNIKVGHAGTLDPLATGLMILCIGQETKNINKLIQQDKEYIATVNFSGSTISADLEKPIEKTFDYKHVDETMLLNVIEKFIGNIDQVPPIFSAKKINGKRAYDLARKGKIPELKAISVTIHFIKLLNFKPPECVLHIKCSKGTYIRSLVRDIGLQLTGGAFLTALNRIAIGEYSIKNAISIEEFENILKMAKNL
jgi:tRNA pseudouridine55 synthase